MSEYPAIKLTIVFILGILSASFFFVGFSAVISIFIITIILLLFFKKFRTREILRSSAILSSAILIFAIGNYIAELNDESFNPDITEINKVKNTSAFGEIDRIDLIRNNELIFYLSTDSMTSEEFFVKDNFLLLCKVKSDNRSIFNLYNELKPGNYLEIEGYYYKGREERNPGEFDYDAYLKSKGILGILSITDTSSIKMLKDDVDYFSNIIHQIRKEIDWQIKKYHSPETASLLRGLLLADRREINYQTREQFVNAGVVHVLAVSGLHVGYIIFIFLAVFGRFNLFLRSILTMVGLICFMLITGVSPSVFRATVMAIVIIIAYLSNRSTNLFNSISIAALIILIINPNEIYNPGFQLSFAAVLSIALVFPFIERIISGWNIQNKFARYFLLFIGVSLSAQLGTLPFTLLYFNKFSVIALFTNLIVIPGIGIIIAAAIVTLIISMALPFVAIYFASANDLITSWLLSIIGFSGDLEFSHVNVYNYSLIDLLIFYVMLAVLLYFLPVFKRMVTKVILTLLIMINVIFLSSIDDKNLLPENQLSIFMIDVGQGDSFLIKFPNDKTALVDAGNTTFNFDNGERVIIPLLKNLGIEKIDYGIVTHIDSDHYGGFVALILNNLVEVIYKPEIDTSLSKDKKFEKLLRERKVPINYFSEKKLKVENTALYFLFDEKIDAIAGESTNDRSGVFKLVYGETSFLFTGDAEKNVEKIYAEKYRTFLDSDVLKIGHHGSKTSSSEIFLKYVKPEYGLVSAGFKNKFEHPAEEIIRRFELLSTKIYRTDLQKAILLRSDGNQIKKIDW